MIITEERIERMHRRAKAIQKQRDHALLYAWGSATAGLYLCLLIVAAAFFRAGHSLAADTVAASSLLSESTGGYVLTGVAAFMFGVCLTVALIKSQRKNRQSDGSKSIQEKDSFASFSAMGDTQMQSVAGGSEEKEQKIYSKKQEE